MSDNCGKRYGSRRQFVCRRPAGHKGKHRMQYTVNDLKRALKRRK